MGSIRGTQVVIHNERITSENAMQIISQYDIVVDGTDNFPTRYLTNDACVLLKKHSIFLKRTTSLTPTMAKRTSWTTIAH